MDFNDEKTREECLGLIQEIAKGFRPCLEKRLESILNPDERIVQRYVQQLSFQEGAWFRTYHNFFVPSAMIAICNNEGFNRDLVYAAQIHDSGNSLMKITKTTQGAGWEGVDRRIEHMKIGGIMLYSILGLLKSSGQIKIDDDRILKLKTIVETHDNPYIGKELEDPEQRAHRCADRVWVTTALSFYKDLIAYCSDKAYTKKSNALGFEMSPKILLLTRMAFFYENQRVLPLNWNSGSLPLLPNMASLNERGKCEPPYTRTGKRLVDDIFSRRASEIDPISEANTTQEFGDLFDSYFKNEANHLFFQAECPESHYKIA